MADMGGGVMYSLCERCGCVFNRKDTVCPACRELEEILNDIDEFAFLSSFDDENKS